MRLNSRQFKVNKTEFSLMSEKCHVCQKKKLSISRDVYKYPKWWPKTRALLVKNTHNPGGHARIPNLKGVNLPPLLGEKLTEVFQN